MEGFEELKITIHPGINDVPIAPTETAGSNISHMHQQFNDLIDSVVSGNQELQDSINYNYDYFYDYCSSNKGFINANSTTISNNRIYHDGVSNGINNQINALLQRITALEDEVFGDTSLFVFDDFTMVNGEFIFTIPATGDLVEILVNDVTNQYNLFFYGSDFNFTQEFNTSTVEGYGYDYSPNTPVAVTQGSQLTMSNGGQNDPLITNVRLKIVPTNNQTEFIFDNVSFVNSNGYERYFLNIPKTGTLTKIEFNDVTDIYQMLIEYDGLERDTSPEIGSDDNYPYVLNFDPIILVNENESLKIFTEYVQPNLTSLKLTIT